VIVTDAELETTLVFTVNAALVDPAATVTFAGTEATAVLLLDKATLIPPAGAGPFNVTVPVDVTPPATGLGAKVSEEGVGGLTVSVPVCVPPP